MHPRDLRSNIWRLLLSASDQEVREGMDFYPGAHGLCRMFAKIADKPVDSVAGIYAALSPMNGWETNVANTLDVLRYGDGAQVNTPKPNFSKALRILQGEPPSTVLRGRKVSAFYRGIANPDDHSPIAVDRHLICAALGTKLDKNQLSRAASDHTLYSAVEAAYHDLGKREGIGNRLASIAWFVQRRVESGQMAIPVPGSPVCCGRPMHHHGRERFRCSVCSKTRNIIPSLPSALPRVAVDADIRREIANLRVTIGKSGRPRVQLGVGHPFARKGGSQYLSRFVVMYTTGERLRKDEHVHHSDGIKPNCTRDNLEVWLSERHGRWHAERQLLYMLRDHAGRFIPSPVPPYSEQLDDVPF